MAWRVVPTFRANGLTFSLSRGTSVATDGVDWLSVIYLRCKVCADSLARSSKAAREREGELPPFNFTGSPQSPSVDISASPDAFPHPVPRVEVPPEVALAAPIINRNVRNEACYVLWHNGPRVNVIMADRTIQSVERGALCSIDHFLVIHRDGSSILFRAYYSCDRNGEVVTNQRLTCYLCRAACDSD